MVNWFKHDIAAWMDGTEGLSDGAYRVYHVICQLIYQNEGPIALHEHGIAGRCRQSVRAFRRNLDELLKAKKLTIENGRLSNSRAILELEKIGENRMNAAKGGEKSGKGRKLNSKLLKSNDLNEASLPNEQSLKDKTREDETREDETREDETREDETREDETREDKTRADENARAADVRKEIVKAFEAANLPIVRDTAHAEVWLSQGYDPRLCLAVVKDGLARNPSISSLKYFDKPIREAHEKSGPTSSPSAAPNWDAVVAGYKATGNWPRSAPGSEPGMAGCRVPTETLIRHGLKPQSEGGLSGRNAA